MAPDNDDTTQVRDLLAQASELPADQRHTFLDHACRDDAAVRAEVEALLAMLQQADDFLNHAPADRPAPTPPRLPDDDAADVSDPGWAPAVYAPGSVIRHYTLLNLVGEGGFGRVYLAEQQHPVKRQVALKVVKPGMDTTQVIARFKAERQALAMMDHPNIARVLDAGATDEGRPFFVMELVRGVPITEYCDAVGLGLRERLELFVQVCRAVQHAHQKGIIHRDIKPSNVLVTMADGKPIPKVIDFGVAKAIAPTGDMTTLTGERQWMGTPQYMSPEQATGGGDVDTRADIYSLGVLLYELLTGTTPFDSRELREATPAELQRIVTQAEPRKPSAFVGSGAAPEGAAAARRGVDRRRLSQLLRGELDWIVMKALEKDRARRYATADALGNDVGRHMRGEPVHAGPPSRTYRVRKLLRRNRALITAAALVLAALLLGTAGTAVGMVRARRATAAAILQRDAATRSESAAREQAARAAALSGFLRQMLSSADVRHTRGKDLLVRDVLEGAARQVEQNPPKDTETAEAIHHTLGATYQSLGLYSRAAAHFGAALDLRRKMFGQRDIEVARGMADLAEALWADNRYAAAEPYYRESLRMREQLLGQENAEVAAGMARVANMLQGKGDWGEAEKLFRRSLEIRRRLLGEDNLETADGLVGLATLLRDQGKHEETVKLATEALRVRRKLLPGDDPLIAQSLMMLGGFPNIEEALAVQKKALGPDHPEVARTTMILAQARVGVLHEVGADTEALFDDALRIEHLAFGAEHGEIARTLHIKGQLYAGRKDWARAESQYRQAIAMYRKLIGEDSSELGIAVRDLFPVLLERREFADAEDLLLKRYEWSRGKEARFGMEIAGMLAELYARWGRPQKAAEWQARGVL